MTITYFPDVIQGSPEWLEHRRGKLTASEMHLVITPTLKVADNEKVRIHLYELMAQRITGYVEPSYISDDMLRGVVEEIDARQLYSEKYAPVKEVGFVVNDGFGFSIGFSPDGLVGNDGLIECKSRKMKFQIQTISENEVPKEYIIQMMTGMMVTERSFCDFVSYSSGLPMFVKRVYADPIVQEAILDAATAFELKLEEKMKAYTLNSKDLFQTELKIDQGNEIVL